MESYCGTIPLMWGSTTPPVIATGDSRGAGGTLSSTLTSGGVITSRTMTSSFLSTLRVSGLCSVLVCVNVVDIQTQVLVSVVTC